MRLKFVVTTKSKFENIFKHPLFYWTILGILLRYAIGLYTSWSPDVEIWYRTGMSMLHGAGVYDFMYFAYPPVWGYILGFFVKIGGLIFDPRNFAVEVPELYNLSTMTGMISTTITSPTFNFIFKTPLFIFDFLVGYVLYKFVYDVTNSMGQATSAFIMWFFNPLVIVVSAIHGTFDVIPTFFLLLSLLLIYKGNYFISGFMWMLGVLTKLFPIYFAPLIVGSVIGVYEYKTLLNNIKKPFKSLINFFVGAIFSIVIIYAPIILTGSIQKSGGVLSRAETGIIVGGLSPWFIRHIPKYNWIFEWAYKNSREVIMYSMIATIMITSLIGLLSILFAQKNLLKVILYGASATYFTIYLTSPIVNSQYLIWSLPILILVFLLYGEYKYKHLINGLTLCGIIFYLSLVGLAHLMIPFAVFTDILDVKNIIKFTEVFWFKEGAINDYLREDLMLITGFLGVCLIVLGMILNSVSILLFKKIIFLKRR